MKYQFLTCFVFMSFVSANAQLGITVSSTQSQANEWQVVPENFIVFHRFDFLRFGATATIDYAFPLKNRSFRLRPGLFLMNANSSYQGYAFEINLVGLQGNIEFALWGDKDNNGRDTPFRPFLQLSPGMAMAFMRFDRPIDEQNEAAERYKSKSLAPNLGANLFLEFKLSTLLVVSPTVGLRFFPKLHWKNFTALVSDGLMTGNYDRTDWRQVNYGLRIGLNLSR